jgi:WD40 repeat protein
LIPVGGYWHPSIDSGTKIKLFDVPAGNEVRTLNGHEKTILSLGFSPDGRLLAAASANGIRLWDVATAMELRTFGQGAPAGSLAFSPDGRTLASSSLDYPIKLWDVATGLHAPPL